MKKISKILILMLAIIGFASCETEHLGPTINPEAERGTLTFVLNQPQYANFTYELLAENNAIPMDVFTTSQPDFGFTAAVTYFVEISFNADMSDSITLGTSFQGETLPVTVRDMNTGIFNLLEGDMPNPSVEMEIFMRLRAVISTVTSSPFETTPAVKPLFSNVIRLNVLPYFVPNLMPFHAVPEVFPFFIIGYNGWNNDAGGLANGSLIPMSVIAGDHYNLEGQGTFVFTGYFEAGRGFKLVGEIGNWDIQWGNSGGDGIDNPVANDGGSSNFAVPADGYYTIMLNTINNTLSIEPIAITPRVFDNMGVVGTINGWGGDGPDIPMTASNNHVWRAEVTVTGDDEIKFRYDNDWANNWGGNTFPRGIAPAGGPNIIPTAGTFMVFFNDIDGSYTFIRR